MTMRSGLLGLAVVTLVGLSHGDDSARPDIPQDPHPSWADSYSVNGKCYCATTFDHNIGPVKVWTQYGVKTVLEICTALGDGPGVGQNPVYNDVQCGNGPANDAGDEDYCPGRVDQGKGGCWEKGPKWDLSVLAPARPDTPQDPHPSWADSYSVNGKCYCATTFDHNIGPVKVWTQYGVKTVLEICTALGDGPGVGQNPVYNDVQCGNGPANDAGDEDYCPGRVDQGKGGCWEKGPNWDLSVFASTAPDTSPPTSEPTDAPATTPPAVSTASPGNPAQPERKTFAVALRIVAQLLTDILANLVAIGNRMSAAVEAGAEWLCREVCEVELVNGDWVEKECSACTGTGQERAGAALADATYVVKGAIVASGSATQEDVEAKLHSQGSRIVGSDMTYEGVRVLEESPEDDDDDDGLSGGELAAIIVCCSVAGLLVLAAVVCLCCRRDTNGGAGEGKSAPDSTATPDV